jgi:GTPase SAR1 family protein
MVVGQAGCGKTTLLIKRKIEKTIKEVLNTLKAIFFCAVK